MGRQANALSAPICRRPPVAPTGPVGPGCGEAVRCSMMAAASNFPGEKTHGHPHERCRFLLPSGAAGAIRPGGAARGDIRYFGLAFGTLRMDPCDEILDGRVEEEDRGTGRVPPVLFRRAGQDHRDLQGGAQRRGAFRHHRGRRGIEPDPGARLCRGRGGDAQRVRRVAQGRGPAQADPRPAVRCPGRQVSLVAALLRAAPSTAASGCSRSRPTGRTSGCAPPGAGRWSRSRRSAPTRWRPTRPSNTWPCRTARSTAC